MPLTGARPEVEIPDDVDLEGTLADWQAYRRKKRLSEVHWVDAVYRAYLAALVSGAVILGAASLAGDGPATLSPGHYGDAAAVLGVVVAAVLFVGLRSGSRGGPLALEAADVRHVLTSPVDRRTALRGPAFRQLRFLTFAAVVAGATAGHLADRRLDGNGVAWTACGALVALATVALAHGVACCTAGLRVPPAVATAVGLGLVGWSVADAVGDIPMAPTSVLGRVALWPIDWEPAGIAPLVVAAVAVVAGLQLVGGTSLERLERRSRLVGQIRFAATLQDLRTVIVLRRQLTQERARTKPWLRPPLPSKRWPVLSRDLRSLLRWPLSRAIRLGVVVVIAGLAGRAAFDGTSAMVVVAGLALFLGGLDAAEPLGQEVDHPSRRDDVPMPAGWIYVWHLPVIALVSIGLAAAAAAVAVLVDPVGGAWPVAAACILPAGLGAAAGAVVNVLMGAPDPAGAGSSVWSLAPPEAAGMRLVYRLAWPPALAVFGATPLLIARAALDDHRPAAEAAMAGLLPAIGIFALVAGWARFRDDIRAWWAKQSEAALGGSPGARAGATGATGATTGDKEASGG